MTISTMSVTGTEKSANSKYLHGQKDETPTHFEDAIFLTGTGKFHLLLLASCGFCLIAMVGEVFGTAFLIPAAQCEFNMGATEKGLLNAITYIGMISSSHLWGYLADTKGRRKMLILALIMDGICGLLSCIAPTYWLFALLRFLNGFFICAPSAVVFAYLGEFHSNHTRSRAVLFMSVFLSLGGLFQQGLSWLVIPQEWAFKLPWPNIVFTSWRMFVFISALPSFIAALILFALPESPKFLFSIGKEEEALEVLRYVYSLNSGRKREEYPVNCVIIDRNETGRSQVAQLSSVTEIIKSMWYQTKPLFKSPNLLLTTLAFVLQFSLYASFNGYAMWLPDIYNRYALYTEENVNHTLTVCQIITALQNNPSPGFNTSSSEIQNQSSKLMISSAIKDNTTSNLFEELIEIDSLSIDIVHNNTLDSYMKNITAYVNSNMSQNNWVTIDQELWSNATTTCISTVNPATFRNSMFMGCVCIVVYTIVGYLVGLPFMKKKPIMVVSMLTSSIAGACLFLANTELMIVALSSVFIALSGVCCNMVNSIVIDNIPTQLRAMAVCLALMSGRFGVTVCSLVLGVILDIQCNVTFFLLGGIMLVCCFLTFFLPESSKHAR